MLVSQNRFSTQQRLQNNTHNASRATQDINFGRAGEQITPKIPLKQKIANASSFVYKKGLTPIGHGLAKVGNKVSIAGMYATIIAGIYTGSMSFGVAVISPIDTILRKKEIKTRTSLEDFDKIKENAKLIADKNCIINPYPVTCLEQNIGRTLLLQNSLGDYNDYLSLVNDSLKRDDSLAMGFSVSKEGPKPNTEFNVPALRAEDSSKKALTAADAQAERLKVQWLHSIDSAKAKIDLRVDSVKAAARHIKH